VLLINIQDENILLCDVSTLLNKCLFTYIYVCSTQITWVEFKSLWSLIFTILLKIVVFCDRHCILIRFLEFKEKYIFDVYNGIV
jgi:hypothetical protein